jgi:hypothetical protein
VWATTIVHGGSAWPFANTAWGYVGSATYWCNNGNFTISSTCNPAPVNCSYTTTWWSGCSASCGGWSQSYYYRVTAAAQNGGTCPVTDWQVAGSQSCNTQSCITYSYYGLSGGAGWCGDVYGGYQEIYLTCVRNANGAFDGYDPWPWNNCPGLANYQGHTFKTCSQPFDGNWTYIW